MTSDIFLTKINDAYIRVVCDNGIAQEISDHFTFEVENAKFMPSSSFYQGKRKQGYIRGSWDGKIRLLDRRNNTILTGLAPRVVQWAKKNGYSITIDDNLKNAEEFSLVEAEEFVRNLNLPSHFDVRDYQIRTLALAVRYKRKVILSPTASGKSLSAYLITRYFRKRTLIIVPTKSLVRQMIGDFAEYGYAGYIHGVMGGEERENGEAEIIVSTWQSAKLMSIEYLMSFGVVIGDEAHIYTAKEVGAILTRMNETSIRIGMSGTLDGAKVHELQLEGHFGTIDRVATTKELQDRDILADLFIKIITFTHPEERCKRMHGADFEDEVKELIGCEARNRFIRNLALSLKGNTLVLYSRVDTHGSILYDMLREKAPERDIFYVHGGTHVDDREDLRKIMEEKTGVIGVTSFGTFQAGINIKNINNIIFAFGTKSTVRLLQSIGRELRRSKTKTFAKLFDLSDDMSWKNKPNHTLRHLAERIKIYTNEEFPFEFFSITLKG